jgi:hypothetical protein
MSNILAVKNVKLQQLYFDKQIYKEKVPLFYFHIKIKVA